MSLRECQKFQFFLSLTVFISLTLALTSCGTSKTKLISRGEELLKKRKFHEAIMDFRAVADIDKDSAEAHWGLARAYEGTGQIFETIEELRQVAILDPNNLDAKSKLGNYFLLLDPPQIWEVDKLLTEIFEANPNFVEGHILKASKLSAEGKSETEVLKVLEQAISLDVNRVESYLSLARFYQKQEKSSEAEKAIQKAISINQNSALGYMEYGRFLSFAGRSVDAEKQFKKALETEPDNLEAYESIAAFYLLERQLEKAENTYKKIIEIQENSAESKVSLADFYAMIGRENDAINTFQEILKDSPEYVKARYRLGEIYLERKELDKTTEQIEKLLSINDRDYEALLLRSRVKLQENNLEEAIKDLEEILKKKPSHKLALFYMAQSRLSLGQGDQARAFINDLEKYHPSYLRSKLLHIQASFSIGEPEKALQQANNLMAVINNSYPNKEYTAQDLEELRVRALSARGLANLELGKLEEAKSDLQQVQKLSPNSAGAYLNLARLATAGRNLAESLSFYEKALTIDGKSFDAVSGIVEVLKKQKQFAQARTRIDGILSKENDKKLLPALHYLKANVFSAEKDFGSAESELQKAIEADNTYLPAYSAYADILVKQNQIERALEQYDKLIKVKPDASIYTLIGMLEDARGNYQASEQNYRKALQLNPQNIIAANNLAWNITESENGNLDEAVNLVQQVIERNPNNAGLHDTLGWAYFKKGLYAPAVENLKKAVSLDSFEINKNGGKPNPGFRVRLGVALASAGDKPSAKKEVEIALKSEQDLSQKELMEAKSLLSSL